MFDLTRLHERRGVLGKQLNSERGVIRRLAQRRLAQLPDLLAETRTADAPDYQRGASQKVSVVELLRQSCHFVRRCQSPTDIAGQVPRPPQAQEQVGASSTIERGDHAQRQLEQPDRFLVRKLGLRTAGGSRGVLQSLGA